MYLILLALLVSLGSSKRILQNNLCPNATTSYRLFLIDGSITDGAIGCSYSFNLTTGNCSIATPFRNESLGGYVCFNASSEFCPIVANAPISGTAIKNCGGNITSASFPVVTQYVPSREFTLTTEFMNAQAVVGFVCNATGDQGRSDWYPRNCTIGAPSQGQPPDSPEPASFAYAIPTGLATIFLLIILLI